MATLTVDDVRHLVGGYDDIAVAGILATGATPAEILRAVAWLRADEETEGPQEPLTGASLRVLAILERALPDDEPDDPDLQR